MIFVSYNTIASTQNFSIEFRTNSHSCRQINETEASPSEIINFGNFDSDGNCIDDANLKCMDKITFFTIAGSSKFLSKMDESVLCQFHAESPACFEVPFIINSSADENFLEITDMKYEFGSMVKNEKSLMNKEHVLGRWKKFIQIHESGCEFKEIEFKVFNR